MAGRLEVITGTMFSGKSEELIRRVHRLVHAKQTFIILKPTTDTRSGEGKIKTHDGTSREAYEIPVAQPAELMQILQSEEHRSGKRFSVVAIDEAQFFPAGSPIIEVVNHLLRDGYRVIVAGLDLNFRGEHFGIMPYLLAMADEVTKLRAICQECGADDARLPQRFVRAEGGEEIIAPYDDPLVKVGGQVPDSKHEVRYEARCRDCFIAPLRTS